MGTRCAPTTHFWRYSFFTLLFFFYFTNDQLGILVQGFKRPATIVDREDDYRKRRLNRLISPARNDAFAMGDRTPANDVRTYGDILKEQQLARERDNTLR